MTKEIRVRATVNLPDVRAGGEVTVNANDELVKPLLENGFLVESGEYDKAQRAQAEPEAEPKTRKVRDEPQA